ncbi:MAG TPA: DUF4382 domain-containing protein [Candidatus Acidoferrum sp.]|nr:DUF4382 domain-containing protein [Candidatus Acidoferrum sp.]
MNSKRNAVLVAIAAIFLLSSCSGAKNGGNNGGGGNGDATLSVTLAAVPLTPPPGTSILSFVVAVNGLSLTPSGGGSDIPIALNTGSYVVDLTRLQSDSAFLGIASAKIPPGTYNVLNVSLSATVTYCTVTSGTPGCNAGSIAQINKIGTPMTSNFSMNFSANQKAALRVQVNFNNILTVNSGTQAVTKVDLTAANVVTTLALPPAASSLLSGQLDFIEDVTGIVTATSSSSVTVQTATRGTLTSSISNNTIAGTSCVIPTMTSCSSPAIGQVASFDAALNPDGSSSMLLYDPISSTSVDLIEGIDTNLNASATQFQIVTNEIVRAPSGSLIGSLNLGDTVNVTLNNPRPFVIDGQGLPESGNFLGLSSATDILPGQTVALHVTNFTAKSGNSPASATVDIVVLRFTRVAGSVSGPAGLTFNIGSLPPFFGQNGSNQVQLSSGTHTTNIDGYTSVNNIATGDNVSIRALFFGVGSVPAFSAAKVRKN